MRNSDNGNYGVSPLYQEGTELRTAKILSKETGDFDAQDSELTHSGLPSKLGTGSRRFYTTKQYGPSRDNLGLSRLCLYWYLILDSYIVDLDYSGEFGRVVLVGGEATQKNQS